MGGRKSIPQRMTLVESRAVADEPVAGDSSPPTPLSSLSPSSLRAVFHPRPMASYSERKTRQQPFEPIPHRHRHSSSDGVATDADADTGEASGSAEPTHPRFHEQRAEPAVLRRHRQQQQKANQQPRAASSSRSPHRKGRSHSHSHNHGRRHDDDKSFKSGGFFFGFGKSAKSSDRADSHHHTDSRAETRSRDSDHPALSKEGHDSNNRSDSYAELIVQRPLLRQASKSELSLASSSDRDSAIRPKRSAPAPSTMNRSRSNGDKESPNLGPRESPPAQFPSDESEKAVAAAPSLRAASNQQHDRSFRDKMSTGRNHSADRAQQRDTAHMAKTRERDRDGNRTNAASIKESNGGSAFFSGLKNSRAADIFSKGLFGKNSRQCQAVDKEPVVDDELYVLKVITLPLVEQTRRTRISKRLENSRDKTEFWMPAFPWRAIDFLNYKGSDVEGLYRVPGSGPQVKRWQRKFDEELDVDLFEQKDLYDINIIGSMLKAWLRELPDELLPKEAQERIARECAGSETVPQMFVDELSNLSPFNYYLLFAITCHLSLLLAHSDKNKMDFRNLCICFQPCMKIDAFCFKFLVCNWRECWQGCKTESRYIAEEYALFDQPPPRVLGESRLPKNGNTNGGGGTAQNDSPPSPQQSFRKGNDTKDQKSSQLGKKPPATDPIAIEDTASISTTLTANSEREAAPRSSGDLRPLSPISPLSPLNF